MSQTTAKSASQSIYPYLRRAELYIANVRSFNVSPIPSQNAAQTIKLVGDGTTNNFRIRFEVRKSIVSTGAPTYIYIYNLGEALRRRLQSIHYDGTNPTLIELKVGWENVPLATIFSGDLLAAYSERQGPDIVTAIVSIAGYGAYTTNIVSKTFAGNVSLSSIVSSLASQLPGVVIAKIDVPDVSIGTQGYSGIGSIRDWLNEFARDYGFWWTISNGQFFAVIDGNSFSQAAPLISYKNGFLMRVEPILATPFQANVGVSVQSVIDARINAGGWIQVESKINPSLNAKYQVHEYNATGDTHGNEWDLRLNCLMTGGNLQSAQARALGS